MGAGGTGGYFGGLLARAGEDVTFIARGAQLAALQTRGLTVRSRLAGDFTVSVRATDNPQEVAPVELVLFCVKAYDTDAAAQLIQPLVGSETGVLPLQNGVDAAERLAPVMGGERVIGGVALITSSISGPGIVTQTGGAGKIIIGELGEGRVRVQRGSCRHSSVPGSRRRFMTIFRSPSGRSSSSSAPSAPSQP